MATSKFFVFFMFSTLIFIKTTEDSSCQEQSEVSDSSFRIELEKLKARVSFLESIIDKSNLELRSKDEIISQMDTIIQEKLDSITSSLTKMSLQKTEFLGGNKDGVAEQEEQKNVQKARLVEASSLSEESMKVWEKAATFQQYAQMFITVVMERIPIMNKQVVEFVSHLESDKNFFILKTIDVYYKIKNFVVSLIARTQREVIPFFQEAQKFLEPHVNHVTMLARPYLAQACITLHPYTRKAEFAYRKLVDSVSLYHMQIQEILKTNEVTRSLATIELASFVAILVLTLPVIILVKMYSTIFIKKSNKPKLTSRSNYGPRRLKRRHPDL